jgi:hypothetical protein
MPVPVANRNATGREGETTVLLNQSTKPTARHYTILGMAWAGWMFDFYYLMLFSFLLVPIKRDLGLSDAELSSCLGPAWPPQPLAVWCSVGSLTVSAASTCSRQPF